MSLQKQLLEKFKTLLIKGQPDDCWPFPYKQPNGYGVLAICRAGERLVMYTHRLSWLNTHGSLPSELHVCHKCDNPICVNPSHLFLGTDADNHADKVRKMRQPRGEGHKSSFLKEAIIRKLKSGELKPSRELARKLGVSDASYLYGIRDGKYWKHIPSTAQKHTPNITKGADSHMAKINEDDVRAIRASTEKGSVLARRYGIAHTTILHIKQRKSWKHVV